MHAAIKTYWADFVVEEQLGFEPSGDGQHAMLQIEKRGLNTADVIKHLSKTCSIPRKAVGYSGLKDKEAITTQFFTLDMAGRKISNFSILNTDRISVISTNTHKRKLKIGSHQSNRFSLVLRQIEGDRAIFNERLLKIKQYGMPNLFGAQRFGKNRQNLIDARRMFAGSYQPKARAVRSMLYGAVRAFLFNEILHARIKDGSWNQFIYGDVYQINTKSSLFLSKDESDITKRLHELSIHPTGILFGSDGMSTNGQAALIESKILSQYAELTEGILAHRLKAMRRALRVSVTDLEWGWHDDNLHLKFSLSKGSYATSLVDWLVADDFFL